VNWNGAKYVAGCLNSLLERLTGEWEAIVVDNASADGSAEIVARDFPWAKLVRSTENLGFAAGNNLAARHATGKYLLLLNNDTVLLTDVAAGLQAMEDDPRIGIVGARMYGCAGELRPSAGPFPSPMRLWLFRSMWRQPAESYAAPGGMQLFPVDCVEGSFLLTTAENWRALGGMDERNYMYGDDIDFCKASSLRKLRTVLCPALEYVHFGGYQPARMPYLFAGYRRYHEKFSDPFTRWHAYFVLRTGLFLRLFSYAVQALVLKRDEYSRQQFKAAWALNWNWRQTAIHGQRFHQ
jgi:hypothetical protein